jgi:hypothetical protein
MLKSKKISLAVLSMIVLGSVAWALSGMIQSELEAAEHAELTDVVEVARSRVTAELASGAKSSEPGLDLISYDPPPPSERDVALDAQARAAIAQGNTCYVAAASDELIIGYGRIDDSFLRPAFLLRIVKRRPVWARRHEILILSLAALGFAGAALLGLSYYLWPKPASPTAAAPLLRQPRSRADSWSQFGRARSDEQWVSLLGMALADPVGLRAAFADANRLVTELLAGTNNDLETERAALGDLAANRITRCTVQLLGVCLDLEAELAKASAPLTPQDRARVGAAWTAVAEPLRRALDPGYERARADEIDEAPGRSSL